jgi:endo-1,4-beta-xylanase
MWTRAELLPVLRDYIHTVVGHFRGRVAQWDVVNEAIDPGTNLRRQSLFQRVIGPDYVALAFRWAHEADPKAQLFYNDYGAATPGPHYQAVLRMVHNLRAQGVPIHGVGLQMHLDSDRPTYRNLVTTLHGYAGLGLKVELTEMDMQLPLPISATALTQQGQAFARMTAGCLAVSACTGVTFWGVDDGDVAPAAAQVGRGDGTLFDPADRPKPGYRAVALALAQFPGPARTALPAT